MPKGLIVGFGLNQFDDLNEAETSVSYSEG